MGEGNRKLSKRDPEGSFETYRDDGYIPEGLINYLALLGWSIADDHDIFSRDEMVAAFDIADVNANPARFDPKKCEVDQRRAHPPARRRPTSPTAWPIRSSANAPGSAALEPAGAPDRAAAPLVQERIQTLAEGAAMVAFLLVATRSTIEEAAAAKHLDEAGSRRGGRGVAGAGRRDDWTSAAIEAALRAAPDRPAGSQARQRLRADPRRGDRQRGVAAAVRVAGTPGPGRSPGPPAQLRYRALSRAGRSGLRRRAPRFRQDR